MDSHSAGQTPTLQLVSHTTHPRRIRSHRQPSHTTQPTFNLKKSNAQSRSPPPPSPAACATPAAAWPSLPVSRRYPPLPLVQRASRRILYPSYRRCRPHPVPAHLPTDGLLLVPMAIPPPSRRQRQRRNRPKQTLRRGGEGGGRGGARCHAAAPRLPLDTLPRRLQVLPLQLHQGTPSFLPSRFRSLASSLSITGGAMLCRRRIRGVGGRALGLAAAARRPRARQSQGRSPADLVLRFAQDRDGSQVSNCNL